MLITTLLAAGVVLLAEMGDKSQLLVLALATRRPPVQVLVGAAVAAVLLQGASVLAGATVADAVPTSTVSAVAGLGFLVAAVLTLRAGDDATPAVRRGRSTVLVAAASILVAELGDKTMLASAALATSEAPLAVWLGGTVGFVVADALAVVVGLRVLKRLPLRRVRLGTAALFAVLGVAALVSALAG